MKRINLDAILTVVTLLVNITSYSANVSAYLSNSVNILSNGMIGYDISKNYSYGVVHWKRDRNKDWDVQMALTDKIGVGWIRVHAPWSEMEVSKGVYHDDPNDPYTYWRWQHQDTEIALAHAVEIKVLLLIEHIPSWANYDSATDFGEFVSYVMKRLDVDAVMFYSEPHYEWKGTAQQLANFCAAGYNAVKATKPYLPILSPSIDSASMRDPTISLGLKDLYDAGINQYFDILAVQPYPGPYPPEGGGGWMSIEDRIKNVRNFLSSRGEPDREIWVTETGWTIKGSYAVTLEQQGEYLPEGMAILSQYATHVFWFCFAQNSTDEDYGLVSYDLTQLRPSYYAYKDYLTRLRTS